ncbi:mercuric resistance operon regulatory protein [Pseudomonas sp. SCT]|uniref:Hg(II)-responsive transcriptional regulator n=1 Tax=Pseudomonas sp. (strain SCT) TaxID=412955 RepID=UPI000EC4E05D|nr:Hg(II)-responsive transcriptional regulator [Pseudomonas sp. SCT]GCA58182.1 mercuric resistance operon regulatory protein [Pseudomonas sp. SCT]
MKTKLDNLTIGVFAKAAGVNVETIRYYQRRGLLPQPEKLYGSIRRYGDSDIARVKFIKFSQRLGFSLDEVAQLLTLEDGTNCAEAAGIAEHKLADIRSRLQDLKQMDAVLSRLVRQCHHGDNKVCCPLIASLRQAANTARFA